MGAQAMIGRERNGIARPPADQRFDELPDRFAPSRQSGTGQGCEGGVPPRNVTGHEIEALLHGMQIIEQITNLGKPGRGPRRAPS